MLSVLPAAGADAARLRSHSASSSEPHQDRMTSWLTIQASTTDVAFLCTAQSPHNTHVPHGDTQDTAALLLPESPMARLKCSMSTAVFLTSELYTSEPTIGQKGTLVPSS